jgi:hypothetical protein
MKGTGDDAETPPRSPSDFLSSRCCPSAWLLLSEGEGTVVTATAVPPMRDTRPVW